jgi:O-antigen/teichoic acid export membrane protein
MTFGAFFCVVAEMGISTSFWKFRSDDSEYSKGEVALNTFLSQLLIGMIILIISLFLKFTIAKSSILGNFIIIYFFVMLVSIVHKNVLLILRANHRAKYYISISLLHTILLLLLNIFFVAYLKLNYKGVIIGYLLTYSISSAIFYYILKHEFDGRFNSKLSRRMIKYGYPIAIGNIAAVVISLSDRLFLKQFSTMSELGLYSYGYKFADLVKILLINSFFLGWNPIRWEIYQMREGKKIFARFNKLFFILLPTIGLMIVSAAIILGNFMTVNKEYLFGFRIIIIIAFSNIFYGLYYFNAMGMLFRDKTKTIMYIITSSAIINIVLNFLLISPLGMLGAAIATIISYLTMFILGRHYSQKYYPIKRNNYYEITQILLMSSIVILLTYIFYVIENVIILGLIVFGFSILYLSINLILKNFTIDDIVFIKNKLKLKKN